MSYFHVKITKQAPSYGVRLLGLPCIRTHFPSLSLRILIFEMGTTIPTPQGLKWSAEAKFLGVWYTVGPLFGSPCLYPTSS